MRHFELLKNYTDTPEANVYVRNLKWSLIWVVEFFTSFLAPFSHAI